MQKDQRLKEALVTEDGIKVWKSEQKDPERWLRAELYLQLLYKVHPVILSVLHTDKGMIFVRYLSDFHSQLGNLHGYYNFQV